MIARKVMGCDYRRSIIDVGLQPALDLKSVIGFWPIIVEHVVWISVGANPFRRLED